MEVGDPDRAGLAVGLDLLHRAPGLGVEVEVGARPVDEVEVDVVETELLEAQVDRVERALSALVAVPQLGGDEQLVAVDAGALDRLADAQLVAVRGRGVDVAVADLEGVADDPIGLVGVDLEDSEAELRDRVAVVEDDLGYRHVSSLAPSRGHDRPTIG